MTPQQTPEQQTNQYDNTENYIEQNEVIKTTWVETQNEIVLPLVDEKFSELEKNISVQWQFDDLRSQISDLRIELRKAKHGRGKEVRQTNKYINDWFDKLEFNIKKVQSGKFTNLNPNHVEALKLKVQTLINNANNYKSQLVTWDLDEAKKFFPPNVFDDATFYIPDIKTGDFDKKTNNNPDIVPGKVCIDQENCTPDIVTLSDGSLSERFAQNWLLWAIDTGIDKAGAGVETRARAYKMGNLVRSATKLWVWLYAGWNFIKSARKTVTWAEAKEWESNFWNMTKFWAILAGWYVFWPSLDKLVKGWDTSEWLASKFWKLNISTPETKNSQQEKLLSIDSNISYALFKDIRWSEWSNFCNADGKLELERFKAYIATHDGENSDRYRLLVEQGQQRPRVEQFVINTLWITPLFLSTQQSQNPNGTIEEPYKDFKKQADAIAEQYDGKDAAQVRTSLDTIEQGMNTNQDPNLLNFKAKKTDLERQANILYVKHRNARPITMIYENNTLYLQTYNQKTTIDISAEDPGVMSQYSDIKRKTKDYNETMRIANLVNFLITPSHELVGKSEIDDAFHISTLGDIEFSKDSRIASIRKMQLSNSIDISVLEDSFFSPRFEELYPSIEADKEWFVTWINSFKKDGKSIWKK